MRIRWKIVLIVMPLIVVPLLLTGTASFLAARNGITGIATRFLRFKSEELEKYAQSQWDLLVENGLIDRPDLVAATRSAVVSFARSLVRSETELILAVDERGEVAMKTGEIELTPPEQEELAAVARDGKSGWMQLSLGGAARVAQAFRFEPFGWHFLITERRDAFYAAVDRIRNQALYILGGSFVIAVILLLLFALYLTRPLGSVIRTMREIITSGDLHRRVEVLYRDETGDLGHTFNLMTGFLRQAQRGLQAYARDAAFAQMEEQKTNIIFQKFVPKDVIEKLKQHPESRLGEDKVLPVLFSDIRSFTTISETMRPDELVDSLNAYFTPMVDVIVHHKGTPDKYLGDGLMAFFGAPVEHDDDALQAVLAGLEMLERLAEVNRQRVKRGWKEIRIGIGINYGRVTVGNIGSQKKMEYTVIGDGVNLASRLEGLTKYYHEPILISEQLFRYVFKNVRCRCVDRVKVKGRKGGVNIYAPRRALEPREEQAWKLHEEARKSYLGRNFQVAGRIFNQVGELLPEDPIARLFVERCQAYAKNPPEPDWDGSWEFDHK